MIRKNLITILAIAIVLCCSCSQSASVKKAEETTTTAIETTVDVESISEVATESEAKEEEEEIPSIDVSDVEDLNYKGRLIRIDNLNKKLGKKIYVSREDFEKYRDTPVTLIGDSISHLATSSLKQYFTNLAQNSVSGRELEKGKEEFDKMKAQNRINDVMVFSLGTNASNGMLMDVFEYVHKGMEGKPFIALSTYFPYRGQVRNRNREIKKFVDTHENCFLADWEACVRGHEDEFIAEDGTHPSGLGGEVYAQLVFKTVVDAMKANGK